MTCTARAVAAAPPALPAVPGNESEPNDTTATASPISSGQRIRAPLFAPGDVDFYRFSAAAGDKVFATTVTSGSAGSSADSQLTLLGSDGTTVVEFDNDNGSSTTLSSSIAGASIPAAGAYYLKVSDSAGTERPYDLLLQVRSGAPGAEVEPNDGPATASTLSGGFASGARDPAAGTEQDWYAMNLEAGDTVFLSLDLDPERDGTTFNGRLGMALFGDARNQILVVDDAGASESPHPTVPSEAMILTVKTSGTYYAFVDSASAATGGPTATYVLSASVLAGSRPNCRTYTVTPSPGTIADSGTTTFPIPVADTAVIGRAAVALSLTHARMADLDVSLQAPGGSEVALFTDIGTSATGGQTQMDVLLDQYAAAPPSSTVLRPLALQPEPNGRLGWFEGQQANGTWKLVVRDDAAAEVGTLTSAELILCARPDDGPTETAFSAGFENGDDGFTHTGTADEWELGTPATAATSTTNPVAALSTCATGTGCWKTDLDNTYDASSAQDLLSPPISLAGRSGRILASWQQWYQIESASYDHASVTVEEDGGANPRTLFRWLDATMANVAGSPAVNLPAAAGWGEHRADVSDFAGKTIRLRFHLDGDNVVNFAGLAIDDVRVFQPAWDLDLAIAGGGGGHVTASGIDCGSDRAAHPDCSAAGADGSTVSLSAHPDPGTTFTGFTGGGCSGAASTCAVTLDEHELVTATFADVTDPETTITSGPGGPTNDATPRFGFESDEPGAFDCRVDSGAFATCTSPKTTATLGDGVHTFYVRATDSAGNRDASPAERSFAVDATPPVVTIDAGPSGVTNDPTPTFGYHADEAVTGFACRIDSGAAGACPATFTASPELDDGPHTFSVAADDLAANSGAQATRAFTVDTNPPDTTITSGPSASTTDHRPAFAFASTEPGSTFACDVDAAGPLPCSSPFTTATLDDGSHTFTVTATDPAGNADPVAATRSFTTSTAASPPPPPPPPSPLPPPPPPPPSAAPAPLAQPGCPLAGSQRAGSPGADRLLGGTLRSDVLFGLGGNDVLRGGGGRDCLVGGSGSDRLYGGTGSDRLYGGTGSDRLFGGHGLDRLFGGSGDDLVYGEDVAAERLGDAQSGEGNGRELLSGDAGNDRLVDRRGRAILSGGTGSDVIDAADASSSDRRIPDAIRCGAGRDVVRADVADHVASDCERVRRSLG